VRSKNPPQCSWSNIFNNESIYLLECLNVWSGSNLIILIGRQQLFILSWNVSIFKFGSGTLEETKHKVVFEFYSFFFFSDLMLFWSIVSVGGGRKLHQSKGLTFHKMFTPATLCNQNLFSHYSVYFLSFANNNCLLSQHGASTDFNNIHGVKSHAEAYWLIPLLTSSTLIWQYIFSLNRTPIGSSKVPITLVFCFVQVRRILLTGVTASTLIKTILRQAFLRLRGIPVPHRGGKRGVPNGKARELCWIAIAAMCQAPGKDDILFEKSLSAFIIILSFTLGLQYVLYTDKQA